jgi:hypothetical protein
MPAAGRDRTRSSIAAAVTHNPIKSICPADVKVRVHGRHAHCAGAGRPSARRTAGMQQRGIDRSSSPPPVLFRHRPAAAAAARAG